MKKKKEYTHTHKVSWSSTTQMRYDLMCCLSKCLVYSAHIIQARIYCIEDEIKYEEGAKNHYFCASAPPPSLSPTLSFSRCVHVHLQCAHIFYVYSLTNKHQIYEYFGLVERFLVSMIRVCTHTQSLTVYHKVRIIYEPA